MFPKLACALCWKTSLPEVSCTGHALNRGFRTYAEAHNLLWDFRVKFPGTLLQRLTPADVSTTELAHTCSWGMDTLVDDVECALVANKDL